MDGSDVYDNNRCDSLEEYDRDAIDDFHDPNNSMAPQKHDNNLVDNNVQDQYQQQQQQQPQYPYHPEHHQQYNGEMNNDHTPNDYNDNNMEPENVRGDEGRDDNDSDDDDGDDYDDDDDENLGEDDNDVQRNANDYDLPVPNQVQSQGQGHDRHDPPTTAAAAPSDLLQDDRDQDLTGNNNGERGNDGIETQPQNQSDNDVDIEPPAGGIGGSHSCPPQQYDGDKPYGQTAEQEQAESAKDRDGHTSINQDATAAGEHPRWDGGGSGSGNGQLENEHREPAERMAPTTTGEITPTATMTSSASTPPPCQPSSSSTPKSIKQRLSEIPKRLSRLSLLNALRSGTYVVSEPKNNVNDDDDNDLEAQNKMADEAPPPEDVDMEPNNKVHEKAVGCGGGGGGVVNNDMGQEDGAEPLNNKMEADPEVAELTNMTKRRHSVHRSALTRLLCGLYALILVVFGIVFALANSLTVQEREHLYYLETFQIYLYVGSLVVLLYFQICILRGVRIRNNYFDSNIRVVIRRSQDNLQLTPSPTRKQNHDENHQGHSIVLTDAEEALLDSKRDPMDQLSTLSTRSQIGLPADGEVAHVGEGINFYLRLGALAFSIGSVTLDGFHIASYFETESTTTCESLIFTFVYVLHLIFTFVQTFFLFKNHKLVIDKNKASVRFGLMHLLATNLCVWFITAITETAEDYNQQKFFSSFNASVPRGPDEPKSCYEDMTLARTASPYLFPSTIIYSIIAAGILYRMYQYVGVKVTQRWPSHTSLTSSVPHGAVGMDCEKANKGLFSGLLVAVITLIAIATFFVFESRLNQTTNAIKIFYVTEISLIAITGSCILFGMMKFVQLRFLENFLSLDSVLLVVSLGGAYVYLCFMLISSASKVGIHGITSILSLVVICVGISESTLQTIFILDGLCRRASNDGQVEAKPGRAVVTFVLVCNLALWVVSMFEMKKNMVVPFHIEFYGILPWNIILHLCVPLFIYFRFHSAICLSKIWYQAYQKEKNF